MTKKHYLQEWAVTLANSCLILAVPSLYMTRLKTKNNKQKTKNKTHTQKLLDKSH